MSDLTNPKPAVVQESELAMLDARTSSLALSSISSQAQNLLMRMFADPYLLAVQEKVSLVEQLRGCVAQYPQVSELRVLFGMALCVNLEAQAAIEELREAVRLAPDSFIAQLKLGELWMRLRVCDKAEEHTRMAGMLAENMAQADLARRQATSIRKMKHEGIERGGYKSPWLKVLSPVRSFWARRRPEVALDLS